MFVDHLINQSIESNQPININKPNNQSNNQSISINRSINNQPINQPINQLSPTNQSISINQLTNQSTNQSINQQRHQQSHGSTTNSCSSTGRSPGSIDDSTKRPHAGTTRSTTRILGPERSTRRRVYSHKRQCGSHARNLATPPPSTAACGSVCAPSKSYSRTAPLAQRTRRTGVSW
jgi:hypothetical protein